MSDKSPTQAVLAAFDVAGCQAQPVPRGQAFRAGNLALKRCSDPGRVDWIFAVLGGLNQNGFRLPRRVPAEDGKRHVEGWYATEWIEGSTVLRHHWQEALTAIDAFNSSAAGICFSPLISRAEDPFVRAGEIAWDPATCLPGIGPSGERLFELRRPISLPAQFIQGDPSEGNFIFSRDQRPALIDISPAWRPGDYSIALLVADGIAWSDAPIQMIDQVRDRPEMPQLLLRAILFRLCVSHLFGRSPVEIEQNARRYDPVLKSMRA